MELEQALQSTWNTAAVAAWQVEIFDAADSDDRKKLVAYIQQGAIKYVSDSIKQQVVDWMRATNPKLNKTDTELEQAFLQANGVTSLCSYGVWVYYPWSASLVKSLPQSHFVDLRTCRNRYKISAEEQMRIGKATIGIVGLSAGMAVATTMVLEGVGGRFRIADFDTIGLSNLNRIQGKIADIGINKCVVAARRMLELNPFLEIELYQDGITEENISDFFGVNSPLDLLVEECDELWMKVRLREEARSRKIPVLMDTSDRGLLDIERFDLEPTRPLFHNRIGDVRSDSIKQLTADERIGFVLKILDADQLSADACASLLEIGESISTWPQLGSAVIAGGAVVTDVARRILIHRIFDSGRFSVDIENLIRDGVAITKWDENAETLEDRSSFDSLPERPTRKGSKALTEEEFHWLVKIAGLAPSGGNSQPWRFSMTDDGIEGYLALDRRSPILDFNYSASLFALGCAAENLMLAAPEIGITPTLQIFNGNPTSNPIFKVQTKRENCPSKRSELFQYITDRCTNRRIGERVVLIQEHQQILEDTAAISGARLLVLTAPSELEAIASVVGQGDRIRFLSRGLHEEMISEMRWNDIEVASQRDGIDVNTLELSDAQRLILRLLAKWQTMSRLREVGGGSGLEVPSRKAINSASAVCLLRYPSLGPNSHFLGGQVMQRVWLRATQIGLSIQPMSVLIYLFARIQQQDDQVLDDDLRGSLRKLQIEFGKLFVKDDESTDLLLFRLSYSDPPTARSIRLRPEDLIIS